MSKAYKTHENFLDTAFFEDLKNRILHHDFAWRRRDGMTVDPDDKMYFVHSFYGDMKINSEFYIPYIIPILRRLKAKALIQARTNLFVSGLFKKSGWHTDHDFNCKTAILYLNDCDGGTELKINNKIVFIKADANKMLTFDTLIQHRVVTSKEEPRRFIVNLNYFQ